MTTRLDRLLLLLSTGSTSLVRQTAARQLGAIAGQRIARAQVHSSKLAESSLLSTSTRKGTDHDAAASTSTSTATATYYHGLDGEWSEVVHLLVKVLPYLKSKSWDTRIAAALAIDCIVRAVGVWHPPDLPLDVNGSENGTTCAFVGGDSDQSKLRAFDLKKILLEGHRLLASSGNEYLGSSNGHAASKELAKSLGLSLPGAGQQELGIDVEKELEDGERQQQERSISSTVDLKGKGKLTGSASTTLTPSASPSPGPDALEPDLSNLSARERNALKRKRKAAETASPANGMSPGAPPPLPVPPSKKRILDSSGTPGGGDLSISSPGASNVKDEQDPTVDDNEANKITIAYKGPPKPQKVDPHGDDAKVAEASWVPTPDNWPFATIVEALRQDLLSTIWEVRHGAALGLREILKIQGRAGGTIAGASRDDNDASHREWAEQLAETFLTVFALDRFGDFVGDHVVAPVRETASQTLSALLLSMPQSSIAHVHAILLQMIKQDSVLSEEERAALKAQGRKSNFWEVKHAGLMGLRYVIAVRKDFYIAAQAAADAVKKEEPDGGMDDIRVDSARTEGRTEGFFLEVVGAAILGLRDSDDDVRGVAALALLPLAEDLVTKLDHSRLQELMEVIYICLSDLKDDLSSSVGNVMDLLASLIRFPRILDMLQDGNHALADLVPRLFPFFRHTITSVRAAVVSALNIFLSIPAKLDASSSQQTWIDERLLRLVFQNMIVEEKAEIRSASSAAWSAIISHLDAPSLPSGTLQTITRPHLASWLDILMTPPGQEINEMLFWKHSEVHGRAGGAGAYNVDKAVIKQDLALVTVEQTLKGRLAASAALALLFSRWPTPDHERDLGSLLPAYATSASSHQLSFACILLQDWAQISAENPGNPSLRATSPLVARIAPIVVKALESEPAVAYSETAAILSQIHTQCRQLFGIFKTKGRVPPARIPSLEPDVVPNFTLDRARQAITSDFSSLNALIKDKARVAAQPLLDDLKSKLEAEVARTTAIKEAMDVQVFASLAGAAIALQALPAKMNPLIRSVMNGLKFELNADLQSRCANSIASFIQLCTGPNSPIKVNPSDKIAKNICTFLCQDTTVTPIFSVQKNTAMGILKLEDESISSSSGKGTRKGVSTSVKAEQSEDEAVVKARLVKRGAEMSITQLAQTFGDKLFDTVPRVWSGMSETLLSVLAENEVALMDQRCDQAGSNAGQDLLDCLTVLSCVAPRLPISFLPQVTQLFPKLVLCIQSRFAVIRYVATRCYATLCDVFTEDGMKSVVVDVLPFMADPLSVDKRRGAVELLSRLVETMNIKILPYVIFLVVPILGRMTDSDDDARLLATSTFAILVKLVPLETGIPDPPGFSAELVERRASERDFLTQLLDGSQVADYELPIKVSVELRKYQREGVNWLAFLAKYQLHGILCDDMGLGKTLQSICIMASKIAERAARFEATKSPDAVHLPSLVVCPPTLTGHWQHEIQTYVNNLSCTIYGGDRASRMSKASALSDVDVVITSYDVVRNDIEVLSRIDWNYCVLDEGHIIKNGKTKLAKAIKSIRANHRLILSGTPIQNNVLELWSLFDFLMPGFLGTEESFNKRYGKPIQASRDAKSSSKEQEAGALALEALHKQVLPFLLRRLKEDVLDDLPPKIIQDYYCNLSPLQRDLYENYSKSQADGLESEGGDQAMNGKDTHVFQTLQYLRKLVNHPSLVIDPNNSDHQKILAKHGLSQTAEMDAKLLEYAPKLTALKQLLLDNGIGTPTLKTETSDMSEPAVAPHRVLIFCQLKPMLDLIEHTLFATQLPSVTYMRMDGSTPSHKRHSVVQTFNADPSIDVLLLTTHVGGLGLNLTGADTVIFVEHDWNPMKDLQAMDRAHRLGQKRVVNVYRLITRGTLEEKIMGLQRFKLNIASSVVNQQNADMSTMETENVLDLFTLDSDQEDAGEKKRSSLNSGTGPISQKALLEGLQDLDDQDDEYKDLGGDITSFSQSLQK